VIVLGSISIGGGQSRPRRYPLGRNHQDPAAHLFDQLAQIVEQVIDLRVAQLSNFDPTRCAVEPAGNLAVGLDQQRRNPPSTASPSNVWFQKSSS
jgi:hypothetical protein